MSCRLHIFFRFTTRGSRRFLQWRSWLDSPCDSLWNVGDQREPGIDIGFDREHSVAHNSELHSRHAVTVCAVSCLWRDWLTVVVVSLYSCEGFSPGSVGAAEPQFEQDIAPILEAKCLRCHGEKKRKGELDLRTPGAIRHGGESGAVVVEGHPETSLLLKRIVSGEMPPGKDEKLTAAEIELVHAWIAAGLPAADSSDADSPEASVSVVASDDHNFWSFQPLSQTPVPAIGGQSRTSIDSFVIAQLEKQNLGLALESQPRRLVRRLYFDLLGLPPSPKELHRFLADTRPGAYERLVDRLLASPRFGERWARYWLDTVGYTDTVSYDGDTNFIPGFINGRWRYRDYVIDSLNADKPYDQFLTEQLAGDELIDWRDSASFNSEVISTLAATGFWRNSEDRSDSAKEIVYKWSLLHDTMQTFGTSLLGLTLRCARCHSHKHEPIPQEDYYRLLSLITPAFNIENWKTPKERALPALSAADKVVIDKHNAAVENEAAALGKCATAIREACHKRLREEKLGRVAAEVRDAVRAAFEIKVQKRTPKQQSLVQQYADQLDVSKEAIEEGLTVEEKKEVEDLDAKVVAAKKRTRTHGWIQAVYDVGPPSSTYLLKRGDYTRPGREVNPGFLSVLEESNGKPRIESLPSSSGRRTALARWLTKPSTPASGLVARVMVNRIWQRLTGIGIVASSENLGMSGSSPTHPELLEWLAAEFVDGGWHIKPLIRWIVNSAVYRQTSRPDLSRRQTHADPLEIDPENHLLWQARLRRLESEAIRDSMLVAAGVFDSTMGGAPVPLHYQKDGLASFDLEKLPTSTAKWRRSLYLFQRRVYHLTLMSVFDQPSVAGAVCRRASSAVALQSLTLLNDDLALELAEQFGKRVYESAGPSHKKQIDTVFRFALGRPPDVDEYAWSAQLLSQQAELYRKIVKKDDAAAMNDREVAEKSLMHLCRVLFNSTEFLYIE